MYEIIVTLLVSIAATCICIIVSLYTIIYIVKNKIPNVQCICVFFPLFCLFLSSLFVVNNFCAEYQFFT